MGRQSSSTTRIDAPQVEDYLRRRGYPDARITALVPLGQRTQEGLKSYGYGRPLRVSFDAGGAPHDLVIRTMSPDPFGHERRSDRAQALLLAFDTFDAIPQHIRAVDIGAFASDGSLVSMEHGELFLMTDFVEGELYATDLHALSSCATAPPTALARARALATYLAHLHATVAEPSTYTRSVRDTVGAGEGIFGIIDGYPAAHAVATAARLHAIETAAVAWRWRLRAHTARARRTHGDFHPFNLLFRDGVDFSVLDCSRGGVGEPADDVTCLSINYLFFAMSQTGTFDGALRAVWNAFWETYLTASGDPGILTVVAPFFAWRALVLASPVWYPNIPDAVRHTLLTFAENLLGGATFAPAHVETLLV